MKNERILNFIRKNFVPISIGIAAVVFLFFISESFGENSYNTEPEYGSDIELKIEGFLSSLNGVGECEVIVYGENKGRTSFTTNEERSISGIAVICDGGGDAHVKTAVIEILTRLFGISGSRISVNQKK